MRYKLSGVDRHALWTGLGMLGLSLYAPGASPSSLTAMPTPERIRDLQVMLEMAVTLETEDE